MVRKTSALRQLIHSPELVFLMEAHNGISARIVEEAGFAGIWASGLTMSASMGVRDSNELSWSQVVEILGFMNDSTSLPILLDGDTGYGNFNNARLLVRKLEQIGIAGVCVEDKIFPKSNSLIKGHSQEIVPVEEFCLKIRAMKDTQTDPDFVVVARVESFIANHGLASALDRAHAYATAGADAVLIHSNHSDHLQIAEFMDKWDYPVPVVIVPTTYYSVPTDEFRRLGISVVIWANHLLRSSVLAMERIARQIHKDQNVQGIDTEIVPVPEIFRLQNLEELLQAEQKYLTPHTK